MPRALKMWEANRAKSAMLQAVAMKGCLRSSSAVARVAGLGSKALAKKPLKA